ncbi:hypothetical protein KP77_14220 [Jeotgalibacillus alimentarius]|uniref:Cytochrome c oxidase subunit 4 n=1 Tax=Jeotgalibacillus alimentarius TaxID=135826 RepID=A0A0C2VPG3_9BACL|nr:hypothetical protein [Jeotgalibacillus alimentarius]KIL50802.1 hypothetical protein KP77_14220 [Jeotgalibacillus alimentarius]
MYGWLNIGSLVLGLIAWIIPVVLLAKHDKKSLQSWALFSIASISACVIAVLFQILYNDYLIRIEAWVSLMDTTRAVVVLSSILAGVTIILNVITAIVYNKKIHKST